MRDVHTANDVASMCKRIFAELQNLDRRVLSIVYHAILLPTNTNIIPRDAEAGT